MRSTILPKSWNRIFTWVSFASYEDENISLDESLKLFNDGVELVKDCYKSLNEAKGKVTILKKEVEELKEVQFE